MHRQREERTVLGIYFPLQRREEEHQKELERIKAEKELEVACLRAQQERAKDKQAERVSATFGMAVRDTNCKFKSIVDSTCMII